MWFTRRERERTSNLHKGKRERAREENSSREAYWTEKVKKARRAILTRTREDIDTYACRTQYVFEKFNSK